jgi:hypothetical protein
MLAVTAVNKDASAEIAQANMFNDPPLTGRRFVLVELAISYAGLDDPETMLWNVSIDAVGSAGFVYDSNDCGVLPNELDTRRDIFAGGLDVGEVCFDVTEQDADSLILYASTTGENIFFSLEELSIAPTGVASANGPQPGATSTESRMNPNPIGYAVGIGNGWSLRVNGAISDQTAAILNENMFNSAPPEGFVYALFHATLINESNEIDSPVFATMSLVGDSNREISDNGCGVVPDELDLWQELFPGGEVSGNACFVLPATELTSGLTLYAFAFLSSDSVAWFALQ